MNKVAFYTANDIFEVEHLAVDITKNVYFTLSVQQLEKLLQTAKSMFVTSLLLRYSKGDMWHMLLGNVHTGDLVMGTHGEEGDIDNYWCDSAMIHVQVEDLEKVVKLATVYQDYETIRILCKVDDFDITAALTLDTHYNRPVTYCPFGVITKKECFIQKGDRNYKVVYTSN